MEKINAVITGVGGYVPDYVLTNDEISKMVDTNDEWIMTRIGVKERHILNEEGLGSSYMARKAAKQLMKKTGANPDDIDLVVVATSTPDYHFPSTASILCDKLGLKNAFAFDLQAACSGFLYLMETAANFIRSGRYKKIILVGVIGNAFTVAMLYTSYSYIQVGSATVLHFLYPMFVSLICFFYYKEQLSKAVIICLVIASIGILFFIVSLRK